MSESRKKTGKAKPAEVTVSDAIYLRAEIAVGCIRAARLADAVAMLSNKKAR